MRIPSFLGIALSGMLLLPGAAGAAEKTYTIGVSIPAATHGWTGGVNYHAERTKKALMERYKNLKIVIATAGGAAQQANSLEDLVSVQKIDALVTLPFEGGPLTDPIKQVKKKGIFVAVVDRSLSEPGIQDLYVAGNNPQFGAVAGKYIKERMQSKGNLVVLRGMPIAIDEERVQGFMDEIKGTDIKVLDMKYANWNRDDGFTVMQDFLTRFPKIDAVWCQDDDIALGVIEAVKKAGREKEMFIVGGAGMKTMIKKAMDGDEQIPVDVLYPPSMISTAMTLTAASLIDGIPAEGVFILDSPLITKENGGRYYYPDSPF